MKEILEIKENLKWIDIPSPTPLDIHFLRKNFDFHPVTLDELTHLSARTKVDTYDHYLLSSLISRYTIQPKNALAKLK